MKSPQVIAAFARNNKSVIRRCESAIFNGDLKSSRPFKKHEIHALRFLSIEEPVELCGFLKTQISNLEILFNNPSYQHYQIEKKRGGSREIFAPAPELKKIQKRLNYYLQAYYLWIKPEEVHGFVINPRYLGRHCNIVANAKVHTGKKFVLNIDLQDFFPGISARMVKDVFLSKAFQFSDQIATALTLLTTYEGRLPTGAPSSPVISNFICRRLDAVLIRFSKGKSLTYTRYADDLTFSSNYTISTDTLLDIISLIQKNNFRINEKKLRIRSSGSRQTVTGITVNEKVNVNRKLLKKIRAMLHDLNTNGLESATRKHFNLKGDCPPATMQLFVRRLRGYINFVGQVRGKGDALYLSFKGGISSLKLIK